MRRFVPTAPSSAPLPVRQAHGSFLTSSTSPGGSRYSSNINQGCSHWWSLSATAPFSSWSFQTIVLRVVLGILVLSGLCNLLYHSHLPPPRGALQPQRTRTGQKNGGGAAVVVGVDQAISANLQQQRHEDVTNKRIPNDNLQARKQQQQQERMVEKKPNIFQRGQQQNQHNQWMDGSLKNPFDAWDVHRNSDNKDAAAGQQVVKKDKKGNILHREIHQIHAEDLKGIAGFGNNNGDADVDVDVATLRAERQPLLDLLADAGVTDIDTASLAALPTWNEVVSLYGDTDGPVIEGLERCQTFRESIDPSQASIGTAGLFNTGTNPFAMYLENNCYMPHNTVDKAHAGMRWQVPWGKHMLASRKWNNTASHDARVNKSTVLPVALIRDPYHWMQSECRHAYAASWIHEHAPKTTKKEQDESNAQPPPPLHCPNLVPTPEDYERLATKGLTPDMKSFAVTIPYPGANPVTWPSLVHLWSDWYQQYLQADYPRLIIRFEDLIFHQKKLIRQVCECAGALPKQETFSYVVDAGKWGAAHQSSNMISAMIKYGSAKHRLTGMTQADIDFAAQHLDAQLMKLFHYPVATTATDTKMQR